MKFLMLCLLSLPLIGCNANQKEIKNTTIMHTETATIDTITLGGGCFWCMEAVFDEMKGVQSATSGYMGGTTKNPTYKEVCTGTTGHAEVVQICYDTIAVSLEELLEVFFTIHDPTTLNKQGADVGTQYRSAVFFHNSAQKEIAEGIIKALDKEDIYGAPIVTELMAASEFYKAEEYHQDYYVNNPNQAYCSIVIRPKVEKFKKIFQSKIKEH